MLKHNICIDKPMRYSLCSSNFSKATRNETQINSNISSKLFFFNSLPVCGVWHIDIPSREFQDLFGGAHSGVRVRFNR